MEFFNPWNRNCHFINNQFGDKKKINMKKALILVIPILFLMSCDDESAEFPTTLAINIVNEEGKPVANAEVILYNSPVNFREENSPVTILITDDQGNCTVNGLKPKTFYFVDARKANATNWDQENATPYIQVGNNEYSSVISKNWYSNLSNVGGKTWYPNEVRIENIWYLYNDCFGDNRYKFKKNFDFQFGANTPCTPSDARSYRGYWSGFGGQVTTYYPNDEVNFSLKIFSSSSNSFEAEVRENGEVLIVRFALSVN
ncbi:MAG: hypothetical protein ACI9A7_002407 [Cyclobacteriaceae bacterium]|jgi:hypothetical protein